MSRARKVLARHAHGCVVCGIRYEDNCPTVDHNGKCWRCTTGSKQPWWPDGFAPLECCRQTCRQLDRKEWNRSVPLAGPGPWFGCKECGRTHPFDPRERNDLWVSK